MDPHRLLTLCLASAMLAVLPTASADDVCTTSLLVAPGSDACAGYDTRMGGVPFPTPVPGCTDVAKQCVPVGIQWGPHHAEVVIVSAHASVETGVCVQGDRFCSFSVDTADIGPF